MEIILNNIVWMTFNLILAFLAVCFGWLMFLIRLPLFKILTGFLWVIFVPNTIYIVTDLFHLKKQLFEVDTPFAFIIFLEYIILAFLGIVSFVLALYPFEKLLNTALYSFLKTKKTFFIIVTNFIIAFGVVIGRMQRTNSWEVATNPVKVIEDSIKTVTSPFLLLLVFVFGIGGTIIYFLLKDSILLQAKKIFFKFF